MGPRHRIKAGSTQRPTCQTNSIISTRTPRAAQIHQRTPSEKDNPPIKKPLHRILLLHQKERRETKTGTGLSTGQQVDHPKSLSVTPNSPTRQQTPQMLTLYKIRHSMGLQ